MSFKSRTILMKVDDLITFLGLSVVGLRSHYNITDSNGTYEILLFSSMTRTHEYTGRMLPFML